tara:strand:- start:139 stop:315 length:177 start_codon:yes stop_codon:yes gene_type:complete
MGAKDAKMKIKTRRDGILFLFTWPDKASPHLSTHSLYLSNLPTLGLFNLAYGQIRSNE